MKTSPLVIRMLWWADWLLWSFGSNTLMIKGISRCCCAELAIGAEQRAALEQAERVHVNEHGSVGDFFGVAINECAAEEFREHGALRGFQQELEAVFLF